jgi:hypothetical protein
MSKHKEKTVKEADKKAETIKNAQDLANLILGEAIALEEGKQHSIQQMLAYTRRYKKLTAKKENK